jgi:hypothetical protein
VAGWKPPEWVNTAVQSAEGDRTLVALRCCGRFTAREDLLYHRLPGGVPPFHIQSPDLSPGWVSVEGSGRFDLDWRARLAGRTRRDRGPHRWLRFWGLRRGGGG